MHVLRGCPPGAQRVPHKVVQRFGPQNVHAHSFLRWGNRCVRGCARVQVYIWCLVMSRYATTILAPRRVYMRLAVCLFVCGMYVEFDLVATARWCLPDGGNQCAGMCMCNGKAQESTCACARGKMHAHGCCAFARTGDSSVSRRTTCAISSSSDSNKGTFFHEMGERMRTQSCTCAMS